MKVYNEDKTKELQEYDLSKGYLKLDKLFVKHYDAVEEQGHYETIKEYENGGKDVEWVVDVAGQEEHDEYEDIQVYIPYTEKELAEQRIYELKQKLANTDWIASKLAEAVAYDLEAGNNAKVVELRAKYAKELNDRENWRKEINELEQILS